MQVALYADGKLGDDAKTIHDMQSGALEMAVPDTATLVNQVKGFGLINFPFLFDSEQAADALLDGQFGQKLNAGLEDIGLIGLGFWENGFRNVTNNVREITRARDLQNLRIRVIKSPVYIDTFTALGAKPVPLPFTELYDAMQENKIDGQENPLITIHGSKFYKVQKYLTLTRHTYSVWAMLMSKKLWDQLSAEERQIIKTCAAETLDYQRKLMRTNNETILAELQKSGMKISMLTSVERSEFRRLTRSVIEKNKDAVGKEWTQALYLSLMQNEMKRF
jgi:tripartite ATP-independent transporter DctP family solute receptor